jgi:hypothetical protein
MLLTRQQILEAIDLKSVIVEVPEWGGSVKVRSMSAKDRIEFEANQEKCKTELESIINLLMLTCIDENNQPLFEPSDYQKLQEKSPTAFLKLFKESLELNTLSKDQVEERAKNS